MQDNNYDHEHKQEIEIVKVKPSNFAFIVSAFYFFFGLLAAIITLISSFGAIPPRSIASMIYAFVRTVVLFPIIGWLCGLLFAVVYNLIARLSSGIKLFITTTIVPLSISDSNLETKNKQ